MVDPRHWQVCMAATAVHQQGVIAYPTETVYGLGCDPRSFQAVKKLLELKPRAIENGFILLAAHSIQLSDWLESDSLLWLDNQPVDTNCPTTWVLPCQSSVPDWISGNQSTLAVRITSHPVAQELCRRVGPIISTSANQPGKPTGKTPSEIRRMFQNKLDWILSGKTNPNAKSSRIVDALSGQVVRP